MPQRDRLLELALKGLQADRANLDDEIAEIKRELDERPAVRKTTEMTAASTAAPARKRRRMSAEAKRKISEGMKRRYAEMRKSAKSGKK